MSEKPKQPSPAVLDQTERLMLLDKICRTVDLRRVVPGLTEKELEFLGAYCDFSIEPELDQAALEQATLTLLGEIVNPSPTVDWYAQRRFRLSEWKTLLGLALRTYFIRQRPVPRKKNRAVS